MSSAVGSPALPATGSAQAHPPGLRTLFFTEMWERFSYYGMRALLVLFMVEAVESGGLGLDDRTATAIYGLYTASVYLANLPGGWIADRLLGAQRSIWCGGLIIMTGHFTLAIPATPTFFIGLLLLILGTGLLKPNISAVVGELYAPGDPRRDSGFTIFYMGINIGGALGPLVCSTLGESDRFGWHYGFAAAGVGMLVGLLQFRASRGRLGDAGLHASLDGSRPEDAARRRSAWRLVGAGLIAIGTVAALLMTGTISVDAVVLGAYATVFIGAVAVVYFAWLLGFAGLDRDEKKKVVVIMVLFLAASLFWAVFEQAGSSLNLFAERYTDRMAGSFEIPAGWFQTLNPAFIIILAPFFSALWIRLARRNLNPSTPAKFAVGLIMLGLGFAIMIGASALVANGRQVLPTWLFFTYLMNTMGELALSPIGLSATTRLAPRRYVGQMMGVWFLAASFGSILAGMLAGEFRADAVDLMPTLYLRVAVITCGGGLLLLAFSKPIRRLMGNVE